jgi:hypothetical protein
MNCRQLIHYHIMLFRTIEHTTQMPFNNVDQMKKSCLFNVLINFLSPVPVASIPLP